MTRWARCLIPLTLGLFLLGFTPATARAQEPTPAEGEKSEGSAGHGYIATGLLIGLALFIVAKTARRS